MDVVEVEADKQDMERRLEAVIAAQLLDFSRKTGVEVKAVHVDIAGVRVMGERHAQHYVERVRCEIDL